jgi:tetratricopeptide (TPR) repeat protein
MADRLSRRMHPRSVRRPERAVFVLLATLTSIALAAQQPDIQPDPRVKSPGNAQWAASPAEAKSRAAAEGKLVFYEFDRPQCGNCVRMDTLLYPAFDFEALLLQMVPIKMSLDSPEGVELARRYSVTEAPALLVTTPEGRAVFHMVGFSNIDDFYPHVRSDLEAYRKFARRVETQDVGKLPAKEAYETGAELYQRSDPATALPRLRRAVSARDATASIREEARELLAAVELDLGQVAASRATIERLIATTRDSLRRQRGELFRAQLPLAENKPTEALALFRKFLKDHPNSPYRKQVSDLLERVSAPPSGR